MSDERSAAIKRHLEIMHEYGIWPDANKDYLADGMLYFKDGETKSTFGIDSMDPVLLVAELERCLPEILNK